MKRLASILSIFVFISVGFSSCSMVSVGYKFGDWLIKKRILEYVKFYSPQQKKLEVILDEFMAWHKASAIPQYKKDLSELKLRFSQIDKKPMKAKDVEKFLSLFRSRYLESFTLLSAKMTPLLCELNSEQLNRTKVLLGRKLDELQKRSKEEKAIQLEQLQGKWIENLEKWFGDLSDSQKKLIKSRAITSYISPKIIWAKRGQRTNGFVNVFDVEQKASRIKRMETFFTKWQNDDFYASWRTDVSVIIADFLPTLTSKQKKAFTAKLDDAINIAASLAL